ncbi:hypothetical protein AB0L00_18265 [Actinoallomurus sp. NPDC052308]|uniref:hypothetical protein n=1 Tax=Actinoallomurus sp. NPDC052308 TaxID=3155530 RepID=UPI00342E31A3
MRFESLPPPPARTDTAEADAEVDRLIHDLRVGLGPDDAAGRRRLLLGQLLVTRALGVPTSPDAVHDLGTVLRIAARLSGADGRRDLDEAMHQLARSAASGELSTEESLRAGRWLAAIRCFTPERPAPDRAGAPDVAEGAPARTASSAEPVASAATTSGTAGRTDSVAPSADGVLERLREWRLRGRDPDRAALLREYEALRPGDPARATAMAGLGLAHGLLAERGRITGGEAEVALVRALRTVGGDHPLRAELLVSIAWTLFGLFVAGSPAGHLDEVIESVQTKADPVRPVLAAAVRGVALTMRATYAAGPADPADPAGLGDPVGSGGGGDPVDPVASADRSGHTERPGGADPAGLADPAVPRGLREVAAVLGAGHPLYPVVLAVAGIGLARCAETTGDRTDLATADDCLEIAERMLDGDGTPAGVAGGPFRIQRVRVTLARARLERNPVLVDRAIVTLESELNRLSAADPWTPRVLHLLGRSWRLRGELLGRAGDLRRGCEMVIAAAEAAATNHPQAARLTAAAALARADLATDAAGRDAAVIALVQVVDRIGLTRGERVESLLRLVAVLAERDAPGDAEHLMARVEQAEMIIGASPGDSLASRARGELRAARRRFGTKDGHPSPSN